MTTKYNLSYRNTATILSAVAKKKHTYLFTVDNLGNRLLKVYADKDLAEQIAVFKPKGDTKKGWLLVEQRAPVTHTEYIP